MGPKKSEKEPPVHLSVKQKLELIEKLGPVVSMASM